MLFGGFADEATVKRVSPMSCVTCSPIWPRPAS